MVSEKLQDSEELEALKQDNAEEEIDNEDKDPIDEDEDELVDEDEDELVDEDEENVYDDERNSILSTFRQAIDVADPALRLKMPFINKRLSPSATIQKILSKNARLLDSKYRSLALDRPKL